AAGKGAETLVATGEGNLLALDALGKEVRRTDVVAVADRDRHEPLARGGRGVEESPIEYVEPETLEFAKKHLSAKEVASWKPAKEGKAHFSRTFHVHPGKIELSAPDAGDYFVHLVYRRPADNKSLKVTTDGKDGPETFTLDLPTPEYRVVDLPLRGPKARATVLAEGPAEVAEFSLWSMKWPGPNLAYVRPAGVEGKPTAEGGDDILGE